MSTTYFQPYNLNLRNLNRFLLWVIHSTIVSFKCHIFNLMLSVLTFVMIQMYCVSKVVRSQKHFTTVASQIVHILLIAATNAYIESVYMLQVI